MSIQVKDVQVAPCPDEKTCVHLKRRKRDSTGAVVKRACPPCGGQVLDVFGCDHPGTSGEVTLADCASCIYQPGHVARFERVYIINLARRADRLSAFKARQASHGWRLDRVRVWPATEGDVVGVPGYFKEGGGAWGCLRSHIGILERCLMEGVSSVLVLEDDVEWFSDAWERLEVFIRAVPSDWSQLMLGGQHMETPTLVAPGVVRCRNTQRTHAYAIRGAAIKSLLRAWYTAAVHLDWIMGGDWMRYWPVYAPEPFLFGQSGGKSDISGRLVNPQHWNPPTNALVVHLDAPSEVAAALRSYGFHFGFRRNAAGYDEGLAVIAEHGASREALEKWLSTILWEVASMEGRVACVWHPALPAGAVEGVHGGPVRHVQASSVGDALGQVADLPLQRCFASTHVMLLDAPRAAVDELVGFHRGFWLDPVTGIDRGQREAAAADKVGGLRKWMRHAGEEAERMQAVPLVWCPGFTVADLELAFPDRRVISSRGVTVKAIVEDWTSHVSQAEH
jgi:hypothetical protein